MRLKSYAQPVSQSISITRGESIADAEGSSLPFGGASIEAGFTTAYVDGLNNDVQNIGAGGTNSGGGNSYAINDGRVRVALNRCKHPASDEDRPLRTPTTNRPALRPASSPCGSRDRKSVV